jgi:hypothetical protein
MPVTRLVAINGSGGAYTQILATIAAAAAVIVEDGSVAPQGLQVQYPVDGFTATANIPIGQEPLTVEKPSGFLPGQNTANGAGAFNYRAADVYCQVKSATATATTVRVVEMERN